MASRGSTAAGAGGAAAPGAGAGAARGASFTRIVALASWLPAEAMTSVDPAPTATTTPSFTVATAGLSLRQLTAAPSGRPLSPITAAVRRAVAPTVRALGAPDTVTDATPGPDGLDGAALPPRGAREPLAGNASL